MGRGAYIQDEQDSPNDGQSLSKRDVYYSWKEISQSNKHIVINGNVYDVSEFAKRHPGGGRILRESMAQDVTDAFHAFHKDMNKVTKYMKTLEVGKISPEDKYQNPHELDKDEVSKDFRQVRELAVKMGLFKTDPLFFTLHFIHIVLFDLAGWAIMYYSGYDNWFTYFLSVFCLVTAQAQAGWSQHDYGHLSVFKSSKMNHFMHRVTIGFIKGVSADWWNYRHYRHHAKPNAVHKDPDIAFQHMFILGKVIPRELGEKKKGKYNYRFQQNLFMLTVPPFLLPIIFIIENVIYCYRRRKIAEVLWVAAYFTRFFFQFGPILGFGGSVALYFLMRFFESHWFVFVTQMNHIPMHVNVDQDLSWFRLQLITTCNVQQSFFNDWFTGHLNFQIEHHLFPTMPRHNYHKIKPYIMSLCKKYNIEYLDKPILTAMIDIYRGLKESGELWYDAYHM